MLFSAQDPKSEPSIPPSPHYTHINISHSKHAFELIFLAKNPHGQGWAVDRGNCVGLPGAHGDEIVRSFCFFDEAHVVYTAGEDGNVKAWRPEN